MSEFQESSDTATEVNTEQSAANENESTSQEQSRPVGWVDFKAASPEEIEAKFNDLYGQTKQSKRAAQEAKSLIEQYRSIADEQSRRIADLTSGVHTVVNHLEQKSFADAETVIMQKAQAAFESGDTQGFLKANRELAQIEAQKILQKQQKPEQPKQQQSRQVVDTASMTREAQESGELTPQDAQLITAWKDERDESGKELRPWATNRSSDPNRPDPRYAAAFFQAQDVFTSPEYEHLTMEQKLAEVDRRMGVSKKPPAQSVMGGGLTKQRVASKITLSPEAEKFVVITKFGGSKYKTDAERLDAYKRQLADNKAQGARK